MQLHRFTGGKSTASEVDGQQDNGYEKSKKASKREIPSVCTLAALSLILPVQDRASDYIWL